MSWLRTAACAAMVCALGFDGFRSRAGEFQASSKDARKVAAGVRHWEGKLTVRPGVEVRLVIHVKGEAGGAMTAELDSPDEGLEALKLDPFLLDKEHLSFDLKLSAARYEGKLNTDGTEATGTWKQRGVSLPLTFRRTERPTPVPKLVGPEQIWEGKLERRPRAQLADRLPRRQGRPTASSGHDGQPRPGGERPEGRRGRPSTSDAGLRAQGHHGQVRGQAQRRGDRGRRHVDAGRQRSCRSRSRRPTRSPSSAGRRRRSRPSRTGDRGHLPEQGGGVTLAGTLTVPEGDGPVPGRRPDQRLGAAGPRRDAPRPQAVPRPGRHLTRRGSPCSGSTTAASAARPASIAKSTSDDFAGDVLAGVAYLKSRKEIDPQAIGLIGHSEGGLIAPMVAAASQDVAFIVLHGRHRAARRGDPRPPGPADRSRPCGADGEGPQAGSTTSRRASSPSSRPRPTTKADAEADAGVVEGRWSTRSPRTSARSSASSEAVDRRPSSSWSDRPGSATS